ncbi:MULTISPECIES: FtsX-like permease family protein [Bacillus]|uniref:Putative ABC transporter permease n=1 Tax=Bacillus amyloliquefaciens (strain Y2) TaxID=1155777 RepID=I2C286_BACAY|nr:MULTISPECIES: FtsX-like permease family protein [Bacillus]AFJ60760.1 putative ABC transporter permease [Bacillus velezensis YAU B9601-Y2]AJE77713.1 ABC transporter [Bacillus sp. BH072]AUG34856.1 ABC transporter [Bacillus velezensis]KFI14781.1 ABC transporter [Bacillus velezensis]KOC81128.1 ABC transporter [Bacillus velezensis]
MKKNIVGLSLRFFSTNKFITLTSIIGVILSVSLIISMTLFAFNAKQTLKDEVSKMYGEMDLSVGYENGSQKIIDKHFVENLHRNKNIEQISSVLVSQIKLGTSDSKASFYTVGVNNDNLSKSRYHFTRNIKKNELIVNKGLAESLGVKVGDHLQSEGKDFKLVETIEDLNSTGIAPNILLISHDTLQNIIAKKFGKNIEATYILIKAKNGTDKLSLANEIKKKEKDLRIDIAEEDPFLRSNIESLSIFIVVLSFLTMIVTSLLIVSNFEMFLYKYKNQFAIMRSIGATGRQLFSIVLLQSFFITSIGSILGLGFAMFSNQYLWGWLEKIFSFNVSSGVTFNFKLAVLIMLICMTIIQLFLLSPTMKITKILPLKVIQENEEINFRTYKYNKFIGKSFVILSVITILFGKFIPKEDGGQVFCLLLASILLLTGIFVLFPVYLGPLLMFLAPIIKKISGVNSYVAIKNVIPQVKKNTFVILTISTMMIITVFGSVMLNTIQKNEENALKEQFPTSVVLTSRLGDKSSINAIELEKEIEAINGIEYTSSISTQSSGELMNGNGSITFDYSLSDLGRMQKLGIFTGLPDDKKNIIVISEDFAGKHSLKIGDTVELGKYSDTDQKIISTGKYKIGAITNRLKDSDVYMDWKEIKYRTDATVFSKLLVQTDHAKQMIGKLEKMKGQFPEIQINSYKESLKKSKDMFYQRWSIFIVVISVMLISITIGVFSSLINNINSKRREFAILRTISLSKRGIINVILTQILLYLFIGLLLGVLSGALLAVVISLIDPGKIYINFSIIGLISGFMLLMGLIIFLPLAAKLGNKKITLELTQDNK